MTAPVTRWWWIRHAPVIGFEGVAYGDGDVPCDISDGTRFSRLSAALPKGAVWVASPLSRARQTALALGGTPTLEPHLAEQHFGAWQGRRWEELQDGTGGVCETFWADPGNSAPPGGESFAQVIARTARVIDRLTEEHSGRDIVAVAHGGTIRAAVALALGLEATRALAVAIGNLTITRLDHMGGPILSGRGGIWRVNLVNGDLCGPS
ncbi:MAG: histidine phosphatase family protein [Magnetospirillum sp. WYHS-4]